MSKTNHATIGAGRSSYAGMTLVELMVGLAIGMILLLGAMTVFMQGRQTFRVNESIARLQENGRFVLDTIEPDIRMGRFFGLHTRPGKIENSALQTETHELGPSDCANNWAIDFDNAIEGLNGDATGADYPWGTTTCAAFGDGWQAGTDILTIRRAREDAAKAEGDAFPALTANQMYIQSWRTTPGNVFIGDAPPSDDTASAVHELVAHGYYVSQDSTLSTDDNAVPSLRRKTLFAGGGGPAVRDEEVLPGVEDFQVQLGIDTDAAGTAGRGVVDRYVDPDDPLVATSTILAVRVWVLVRAERIERGFNNGTTYTYAGVSFTPNDSFRRVLVSKTIYIRNARPAS